MVQMPERIEVSPVRAEKEKIAIIGAGFMGPGIGQVFATSGHPVQIFNRTPQKLANVHERIRGNLSQMAEYGLARADRIPSILRRITTTTDLAEACADAVIVIESITESLELKQVLFADLDRLCPPESCLCSNTSVISIREIGALTKHPERVVGTHFYQPPFLVPLVEVVRTEATDQRLMDYVFNTLCRAGKVPIRVRKDVPGFVANRMQHALWREAFALIDEGICDAETVDVAVSNSFGMRLPVLGPVANADLVGLDLTLAIHNNVLQHLDASTRPSSTLRRHVEAGELGFKTGSGFLRWSEQSVAETREKLTRHLLEMLSKSKSKPSRRR
jgi:3-hydroxybutyryl-CoA dehydrogenase